MANQWALFIGINQYKALQPLMYAQPDAVGLRNFWVDELGVSVNHCTLLTDVSAAIEPHAYAPLRQEIEHQLQTLCRDRVQPGDLLWIFFSGCGLAEGGQDYWMTLDSEPTNLSETAIAMSTVFDILSTAKTDQIVLAMDMNRSQGAIGHRDIGTQTLTLAKDYGITTFLSCQPTEFSHETMYVRHGLFTKALLEGMRYHGCVTALQLGDYLRDRVPELCKHHCRPPQHPALVVPQSQKFMMVVPPEGLANLSPTENAADNLAAALAAIPSAAAGGEVMSPPPLTGAPPTASSPSFEIGDPSRSDAGPKLPIANASPAAATSPSQAGAIVPVSTTDDHQAATTAAAAVADDESKEEVNLWKWVILAAIAFLAGVLWRYQPNFLGGGNQAERNNDTPAEVADEGTEAGAVPPEAETSAPDTVADTGGAEPAPTAGPPPAAPVDPIEQGETALQRAQAAIDANRYGEARAWLTQVPPELQSDAYQALLQQANGEVAEAAVRNQDILNTARQIIQPASASLFNDAIEQARQVPPEDPYYEQAQADMRRWGQVILDLAEGRAASGDINGAIAAARLVPEDQPELTTLAQQRIQTWEQRINNQSLLQQTQNSLQPGQASSYNNAIEALRQIQPDQPSYADARDRIRQWSEDILAIARARAAQGDLGGAIGAAQLVPEDSDAYGPAQEEIQRWQTQ
ncbi:MAG: caspase family protein [Cyanobacteria bacterium P01_C01_bin.120]